MSTKTEDLDAAIKLLQEWLEEVGKADKPDVKTKMAITDRLLKALAIKYKYSEEGLGGKFGNMKGTTK